MGQLDVHRILRLYGRRIQTDDGLLQPGRAVRAVHLSVVVHQLRVLDEGVTDLLPVIDTPLSYVNRR